MRKMSDDLSQDAIPVKDGPDIYKKRLDHEAKDERRLVFKLPREELEDRFLRVCEENMILKTHSRKQEDRIKKMATKLIRLINDHKKQEQGGAQQGRRRDLETEELIEEMQDKIRDLDRQNISLKEKLVTAKQQLAQHSKRISPISHRPKSTSKLQAKVLSDEYHEEQRENEYLRELKREVSTLRGQLSSADTEIEYLTGLLNEKETEYEKQILQLKAQTKHSQRQQVDENVELIKIQREMKITQEKMSSLLEQYTKLQDNTRLLKISHDQVVKELESVANQLKDEQSKSLRLRSELQMSAVNVHVINELKAQCMGLEKENEILKESNLKLINSSFNWDKDKSGRKIEATLRSKISEMESVIHLNHKEKEKLTEDFFNEKSQKEEFREALQEAESAALKFKEMYEEIREKTEFLTQENLEKKNLLEALNIIDEQKEERESIKEIDSDLIREQEHELKLLRVDHAETVNELAQLREMLELQYQINEDYKMEVEITNKKLYQTEQELKQKIDAHKRLFESQTAKNEILEKQLADVARGSSQTLQTNPSQALPFTQNLGESRVEICFHKISSTRDGHLKTEGNKASMLTWSFYDFELTATKIVYGVDPVFNCTVVYPVTVDQSFVDYLNAEAIRVEWHQVTSSNYITIATGFVRLKELVETNKEKLYGAVALMDISNSDVVLGTAEFSIFLDVPLSTALNHYKDRSKALGYINANFSSRDAKSNEIIPIPQNLNEISIKITQCKGLKSDHSGVEPTSYIMYKFYDWPDHDTNIIPFSDSPYFNDRRIYRVMVDNQLQDYLTYSSLLIYSFDDSDPRPDTYLGVASVPLFPLVENKVIHGTFEFKKIDGTANGTVDLTIKWIKPYLKQENLMKYASTPSVTPTPVPRKQKLASVVSSENKTIAIKPPIAPRKSQDAVVIEKSSEGSQPEIKNSPKQKQELQVEPEYLSDDFEEELEEEIEEENIGGNDMIEEENEFDVESPSDDSDVVALNTSQENVYEKKITIEIYQLILFEGSGVINNPDIQMLYVEFRFLDFLPEDTETPVALPKPKPNQSIFYNFHKEFKMDGPGTTVRRKLLRKKLLSHKPGDANLTFTLVSEPDDEEEEDSECHEVAFANVNLNKILQENRDLIEEFVLLYAVDDEDEEVGKLKISVHILDVLKTISEDSNS